MFETCLTKAATVDWANI